MSASDSLETHRSHFLEALKVRRFSPATIKSRQASLTVFFGWLAGIGMAEVREVSRQTVRDYQLWLQGRGHAVP
jgi:site-specific recombinase XerD